MKNKRNKLWKFQLVKESDIKEQFLLSTFMNLRNTINNFKKEHIVIFNTLKIFMHLIFSTYHPRMS